MARGLFAMAADRPRSLLPSATKQGQLAHPQAQLVAKLRKYVDAHEERVKDSTIVSLPFGLVPNHFVRMVGEILWVPKLSPGG